MIILSLFFSSQQNLTFHANCLYWKQFAWNVKSCFLGKIREKYFKMSSAENWCLALSGQFQQITLMLLFLFFFSENRIWHFMQIVSKRDSLHEMSSWLEKIRKVVCWKLMLSTLFKKIIIQHFEIFSYFFQKTKSCFFFFFFFFFLFEKTISSSLVDSDL